MATAASSKQYTPATTVYSNSTSMGQPSYILLDELLQRMSAAGQLEVRDHAIVQVAQGMAKPYSSSAAAKASQAADEHAAAGRVWHSSRVAKAQHAKATTSDNSSRPVQQPIAHQSSSIKTRVGNCTNPCNALSPANLSAPSAYDYSAAKAEAASTTLPAAAGRLLSSSSSFRLPASGAVQQPSQLLQAACHSRRQTSQATAEHKPTDRSFTSTNSSSNSTGSSSSRAVLRSLSTPGSSAGHVDSTDAKLNSSSSCRLRAGAGYKAAAGTPAGGKQDSCSASSSAGAMLALQAVANPSRACGLELGLTGNQLLPVPAAAGTQMQQQQQQSRASRRTSSASKEKMRDSSSCSSEDNSSRPLSSRSSSTSSSGRASRCTSDSSSSSLLLQHGSGTTAVASGRPKQQSKPSTTNSRATATYSSVCVAADPAAWLPQQHPAVVAALTPDIQAVLSPAAAGSMQLAAEHPVFSEGGASSSPASPTAAQSRRNTSDSPAGCKTKLQRTLQLLVPQFPATPPTLLFSTGQQEQQLEAQMQPQQSNELLPLHSVKMCVRYFGVANNNVKQVFRASGFKATKGSSWGVLWGSLAPPELLAGINPWQRHNHFPGTWELGRKDRLYRNIAAAARRTRDPAAFNFVPKFFILPADLEDFKLDLAQNPKTTYIRKPVASSRGRGVRVVTDAHALDAASLNDVILQHYIPDPLLIGGRKFDLRVYVAVMSLDPLRVYVYKEGLVRFASEQYSSSKSSLKHATMHLTNYSINKGAANFKQPSSNSRKANAGSGKRQQQQQGTEAAGAIDAGGAEDSDSDNSCDGEHGGDSSICRDRPAHAAAAAASKWSFQQLADHLQQQGFAWANIWQQVCSMVAQTMIAAEPALSAATRSAGNPNLMRCCFEVFGFDVLLDSQLCGWLLEVNTCPALNADSPLDMAVKTSMVADLLGLVGVTPYDKQVFDQTQAADRQARLTGLQQPPTAAAAAAGSRAQSGSGSSTKDSCKPPGAAAGRASSSKAAAVAAAAAAAAARTIKDVEQLQLLAVPPQQLPECIRETQAEWRRCCRQQQRWQRVVPDPDPTVAAKQCAMFETPRLANALVAKYAQELQLRQK